MSDKYEIHLGKYREIVIAVAFFLVFDLGVLILNFYTSYQIAEDAVAINLAGRQRMLSQRMTKSLLLMQSDLNAKVEAEKLKPVQAELVTTVKNFDTTLSAFRDGGSVTGANNQPVQLLPVTTDKGKQIVAEAGQLWTGYRDAINSLLDGTELNQEALDTAVMYGRNSNVKLLGLMNDLTNELERVASEKAAWLRKVQTLGIMLAMLNFVFILFKFIRQLRASDLKTEAAQRETQEILGTVREGLFLLDKDMCVGSQRSASMDQIFQVPMSDGAAFLPILKGMVSEPVFDSAKGYIELLFGNRVKEGLVASLNPLSEVEVTLPDSQGNPEKRYLSFQFNRVVQNKQVPHLLVTVQDVTERVLLMNQLLAAKSEARLEVNVLLRMLAMDPAVLKGFMSSMETALKQVNELLREAGERQFGSGHDYSYAVNQAFRLVHACKGEAATLGLEMLETEAHQFEKSLVNLRDRGNITGDDMVGLSVQLNSVFNRLTMVRDITEQLAGVSRGGALATSVQTGLESLASKIAQGQNKEVTVSADMDALNGLPASIAAEVRQISIQLLRNAVTHGIEHPEERALKSKPAHGQIQVSCQTEEDGSYQLVLRDDGRGLDPERIRVALVAAGVNTADEVKKMSDRELVMRIFDPGFTTLETATTDAGHGVGMDVVMEKVRAIGGRLHLTTRPNEFTQFSIRFPGVMRGA